MRRLLPALLDGLLLTWLVAVGPLCWILRDGMGPNAVDSRGVAAVGRFLMTFYWGPVAIGLTLIRLAVRRRLPGRSAGTVS